MSTPHPFFASGSAAGDGPDRPLAMAHRGFSRDGLENSMAAFRAAVDLGFRHLETDVHTTADGVLLLFHDETLDRITDGRGPDLGTPGGGRGPGAGSAASEPIPLFEELARPSRTSGSISTSRTGIRWTPWPRRSNGTGCTTAC